MRKTTYIKLDSLQKRETCSYKMELTTYIRRETLTEDA